MTCNLYLASRSPRRRELLNQIGVEYEILDVEIDESWNGVEVARDYVARLALEKARAGRMVAENPWPVLAADTEVVIDDRILGKPKDKEDAMEMLQSLSGRTHLVYSAVALVHEKANLKLSISRVCFKPLSLQASRAYCDSGEPLDKAGAYGIQGAAAAFISRLEGSYSGVMGLPLYETAELLLEYGHALNGPA